ncbi:MAG: carboxypeptidase regulatory-like domain-containing protein [Kangiella sp.]|nr:carboxypeptidase regulatory-like domain-containing protein [Kangiella sp.]MCW9027860.1 carboxypeptidase regulatory-like domain-containing protein [Kangiella sp.]
MKAISWTKLFLSGVLLCTPLALYSQNQNEAFAEGGAKDPLELHRPVEVQTALFDVASQGSGGGRTYGFRKILVGLEVNSQEVLVLDIVQTESDYLVPIKEVFPVIQASYTLEHGVLTIRVPGSEVEMSSRVTYRIDGELWASLSTLNEYLKVNARFDPAKYAVTFLPPWQEEKKKSETPAESLEVEFGPDPFSLRQVRLSHEVLGVEKDDEALEFDVLTERSELVATGAAFEGSWLIDAEKLNDDDWKLDDYFWTKRTDHHQWLFGKQTVSTSVIAPAVTLTGGQYFYSNQSVPYNAYQDISQSSFFRELGSSVQRIRGTAEPGAIAELYVNNQLIGETFVRLDGTYDFGEFRTESSLFNEIEVVILDPVNRSELERQMKTRASSDFLLNEGQVVTSVALGRKGNWLDPDYVDQGEAGMFLYRYGVTDGVTVEAGYMLDDISVTTAGIVSSLGHNFVSALRFADRNNSTATQLELDGFGENWRMSTYVRQEEANFYEGRDDKTTSANGYYYYTPDPSLRLELLGRYQETGDKVSYIKPGIFYSPANNFSVGTRPDADGDYRTELFFRPSQDARFRITHKSEEQTGRFEWNASDNVNAYMSGRMYKDTIGDRTYQNTIIEQAVGFYWYPKDWTDYKQFRFELNHSNEYGVGVFTEYRTQLMPGVYFDLRLRDADPQFDGGLSAFARISMDFAVAKGSLVPSNNRVAYNTAGTIAGTLKTDGDCSKLEHVSVLLNGVAYKTPVKACSFYLDYVTPGLYKIMLDGEFMPIDMVPETKSHVIKVAPSSVTHVEFNVMSEYSAMGQLTSANGQALSNVRLTLFNSEGKMMTETLTDQFGYYRVDGLTNGNYSVSIVGVGGQKLAERAFVIDGDFLFGLDISLPASLPLQ